MIRTEHRGAGKEKPPPGQGGGRKENQRTTGGLILPRIADPFKPAGYFASQVLARLRGL